MTNKKITTAGLYHLQRRKVSVEGNEVTLECGHKLLLLAGVPDYQDKFYCPECMDEYLERD